MPTRHEQLLGDVAARRAPSRELGDLALPPRQRCRLGARDQRRRARSLALGRESGRALRGFGRRGAPARRAGARAPRTRPPRQRGGSRRWPRTAPTRRRSASAVAAGERVDVHDTRGHQRPVDRRGQRVHALDGRFGPPEARQVVQRGRLECVRTADGRGVGRAVQHAAGEAQLAALREVPGRARVRCPGSIIRIGVGGSASRSASAASAPSTSPTSASAWASPPWPQRAAGWLSSP